MPEHAGCVIVDENDGEFLATAFWNAQLTCLVPLGFGVTSRSSQEAKKLEGTGVVVFRQADTGEYLREVRSTRFVLTIHVIWPYANTKQEDTLFTT